MARRLIYRLYQFSVLAQVFMICFRMLYAFVEKQRNEKDVDLNVTYFVAGGEIKKDGTKVNRGTWISTH